VNKQSPTIRLSPLRAWPYPDKLSIDNIELVDKLFKLLVIAADI
jgi:hypothetical protein